MRFSSLFLTVVLSGSVASAAGAAEHPAHGGRRPASALAKHPAPATAPTPPALVAAAPPTATVLVGTIVTHDDLPLPGATVWVVGSPTLLAVTDAQGDFSLTLPTDGPVRLSCAYVGCEETQVLLAHPRQAKVFYVSLQPAARHAPRQP